VGLKHNKVLLSKALLVLVILLLGGLAISGCVGYGTAPKGWSGGTIANGTLFLGSMQGKLVALNASDGARLWEVTLETTKPAAGVFGCAPASTAVAIYGAPAVDGDLVYVGGYNGKIYAISSSLRAIEWKYPRGEDDYLQPLVGGAVVALGKVYIGASDGKLYALDAATGDKKWAFQTGDKIWSTPAIDGDTLYIGSFDKKLYALDAITGKEKWGKPFETQGAIASTPLVYNNTVYIGSFDRHLYAVNATNGKQIWQFPVEDEVGNKPENWFWTRPVAYNGVVYAGNLDGKLYILNAETGGEIVGAIDLGSRVSSSPVLVDGKIIIATEKGLVYALDTANNQIRQLANIEEKIYAPLSVSNGVVYVHTDKDGLYAVDALTGTIRGFTLSK